MTGTPTSAAADVLATNRRRRRIRRLVLTGSIPIVLIAMLPVGKVLSMYAFAHHAISSYVVDDYAGSEAAARQQEVLNWFEPYKAPFNVGTALAGAEQLPEARAKFEEALQLARGLEVCGVRINLALVLERMGDAARTAGDGAEAVALYAEALTVMVDTPEECNSDQAQQQSSDPERDMADTRDDLEDRLQQKQNQQDQQQSQQPEPEKPQPSEEGLDKLQEQLKQGTRDRDEQQQGEGSGGSGTDKPW